MSVIQLSTKLISPTLNHYMKLSDMSHHHCTGTTVCADCKTTAINYSFMTSSF